MLNDREVVRDEDVEVELVLQVLEQVDDLPDRHVESADRLVADGELARGEEPRDADALTRPPEDSCGKRFATSGRSPTLVSSSATARAALRPCPCAQLLPDGVADRDARVEERVGPEDDLEIAPVAASFVEGEQVDLGAAVGAVDRRPPVGSIRRRTDRRQIVLPQPDSPTRDSVSPRPTVKSSPSTAFTEPNALEHALAHGERSAGDLEEQAPDGAGATPLHHRVGRTEALT